MVAVFLSDDLLIVEALHYEVLREIQKIHSGVLKLSRVPHRKKLKEEGLFPKFELIRMIKNNPTLQNKLDPTIKIRRYKTEKTDKTKAINKAEEIITSLIEEEVLQSKIIKKSLYIGLGDIELP